MNHRCPPLLLVTLCLLPLAAGAAQPPTSHPPTWQVAANDDWNSLGAQEQNLLKQHQRNWNTYTPEQKARLREGAKRYQKLSPAERQEVEREKQRYETMSPQERRKLREKYDRSQER